MILYVNEEPITEAEVTRAGRKLKDSNIAGIDHIQLSELLKHAESIAPHLTKLFQGGHKVGEKNSDFSRLSQSHKLTFP